jgi:hypothetical protein
MVGKDEVSVGVKSAMCPDAGIRRADSRRKMLGIISFQ